MVLLLWNQNAFDLFQNCSLYLTFLGSKVKSWHLIVTFLKIGAHAPCFNKSSLSVIKISFIIYLKLVFGPTVQRVPC